ncbi:MAG: ABC transporter ATP-binding protein [Methylophaga sp.]|uniref:ABC transporter ATP-binding protein n=1 Tax=Methylophaga sp. TaxID=2024840 RepID=UPI00299E589C|nr:ABC transporter ATP-binding protein [Methylophaga sp.]MDX1750259.1 ABC transporter ATP-binding protein [Methylophaga sp.]
MSTETSYQLKGILKQALSYKKHLIKANLIALFATLCAVPVPLLLPIMVDEVLLDQPGTAVAFISSFTPEHLHGPILFISAMLILTLVLRLASLVLNVLQSRYFTIIAKRITFRIRRQLIKRLGKIAISEYETRGSGGISSHFVTDIEVIDNFIGNTISRFIVAVLSIIGTAVILLFLHWQLALLILFMNPLVIYFTMRVGKHVKHLKKNENTAVEVFQQSLTETLDAIQQIRAANREKHYFLRVIDRARGVRTHATDYAWKSDAANRISFVIFLFGFDIFRAVSMWMVVFSDLSIGQMFAVFGYLWFMMGPVQEVLNIQYAFYAAGAAVSRLNKLFSLKQEVVYPAKTNPFIEGQASSIRIENLHFSYDENNPVLSGVSLEIKAGEKVALVGASGAGKSTLVNVLLGLYPADKGMVYFNDVPVSEIGLEGVREHVATVLQHPALFNDSVRENITLGRDYPDAAIWQAIKTAQIEDVIQAMPKGLDTLVGRSGVKLSGGQRQRLAVARMALMNPSVVVLDEATSALDSNTEHHLHIALADYLKNRTTIIIAHRLSAVRQADRIVVFDGGEIIADGDHDSLIQEHGIYQKLYAQQI